MDLSEGSDWGWDGWEYQGVGEKNGQQEYLYEGETILHGKGRC